MLRTIVPGTLWTAERTMSLLGMPFRTRMTVVRLACGELWVHSPIDVDDALRAEIDALGPVRHVVAPNKWHHLFVNTFRSRYPDACIHVAPGLPEKDVRLRYDAILDDEPSPHWRGEFDQVLVRGNPLRNEVVFFHRPTRTLIVADLLECFHDDAPLPIRLFAKMSGLYERVGPPPDLRLAHRGALRDSIERIAAWDFVRIVLAHGEIVEQDARVVFEDAMAPWLAPAPAPAPAPEAEGPA